MHCTQLPITMVVELQVTPAGQPLPPVPRQPSPHWLVVVLQTLPLVRPPQVLSLFPSPQSPMSAVFAVQTPPVGHVLPPVPRQPSLQVSVVVSQTLPLIAVPQSVSFKHC